MIIAGCSVLGTAQIAQDLLDGAVFVRPNSLEAGKPRVFILAPRGDGGTQWLAPS
jgi:hypothetical protein